MVFTAKRKPWVTALTGRPKEPIIMWKGFSRLESYVQFPIPQITTVMLLVHLGLGCCWHHAHTCSLNCCNLPAVTADSCSCDAHAHHEAPYEHGQRGHGDDALIRNGDKPHRHHCDGDRCSFVPSERSPEQKGELRFDLCPLDIAWSPTKSELIHSRRTHGQDHSLCDDGPPVRAHLLFSVLLI